MGTRHTLGVIVGGHVKGMYNQFDGYPSGTGQATFNILKGWLAIPGEMARRAYQARALQLVDSESTPSPEQVTMLESLLDSSVDTIDPGSNQPRKATSWYQLLRNSQGCIDRVLDAGVMEDGGDFPSESHFCEWGYYVNFDDATLEVYEGFQSKPHTKGRFAKRKPRGWKPEYGGQKFYYPIALIATIPFAEIAQAGPDETIESILVRHGAGYMDAEYDTFRAGPPPRAKALATR